MDAGQERQILITGGCGYVGSVLVPKLARKHCVTVLDSMFFGNHLQPIDNVDIVEGDIRDIGLMRSLLSTTTTEYRQCAKDHVMAFLGY